MDATQQAHQNLKSVLFTGRILINGMPLTANELSGLIQGEQILFEKASQSDAAKEQEKALKTTKKKE